MLLRAECWRRQQRRHLRWSTAMNYSGGTGCRRGVHYGSAGVDVAQSVCPYPMTSLTLREIREGLAPDQALWGGIPSVALLTDSMDDDAFEAFLEGLSEQVGTGHRLIPSVPDNVPPDADLGRLRRIGERIDTLRPSTRALSPPSAPTQHSRRTPRRLRTSRRGFRAVSPAG